MGGWCRRLKTHVTMKTRTTEVCQGDDDDALMTTTRIMIILFMIICKLKIHFSRTLNKHNIVYNRTSSTPSPTHNLLGTGIISIVKKFKLEGEKGGGTRLQQILVMCKYKIWEKKAPLV